MELFAHAEWYLERPEPVQEIEGTLEPSPVTLGPGTRIGLTHALTSGTRRYAVYTGNRAGELQPLEGRRVSVRGKLIDLSSEGFGEELWIATITSLP